MEYWELYNKINNTTYTTIGEHLDYAIEIDDIEKKVYLLFQCTSGKADWISNFLYFSKPYKNPKHKLLVHGGWKKMWKSGNDTIMEQYITEVKNHPDYEPIITGYSLGSSIAQLAVEDLFFRTGIKATMIGFGCPQPFFWFSRKYLKNCCNPETSKLFCHRYDIVTKQPPFLGWFHMIKPTVLGKKKLFGFLGLFNPYKYHTSYSDSTLY